MAWLDSTLLGALPGEQERLLELDAAVRAPLPLTTSVGVLAADGSAPSALVGGLVADVLAARRPHRVLVVAARQSQHGIHWQAGLRGSATSTADDIVQRASATTGEQATAGLPRTPGGAWALSLAADPSAWFRAVAPISRFFDFVLTDWGVRTEDGLDDPLATSGVLVIVCGATRASLQVGVDLQATVADEGQPTLLVVVDTGKADRGMRETARRTGAAWVPDDRRLRAPEVLPSRRLRHATNTAMLELTARVVGAASVRNEQRGVRR